MISIHEKSILLVEDDAILARFEKNQLEQEGYKVLHVMKGENALELVLLEKQPFDLILMDIDLGSGIDGTQTATEILKEIEIPIVFLSSHTEREIVQKTEIITSYGYVVKNSGITILDASIKMAFKLFEANKLTKSKKDHLETVLHSIGDAVIATDTEGRIQRMNPVAEHLTGWTYNEVAGQMLNEIFKIVNVHTRKAVENPVDIVLKTNKIVGLANHTVLIARDGREYQISDSGSPIKDFKGETTGVVLVFRDVSVDYEVQSKLAYQAHILDNVLDSVVATDENLRISYWNKAAEKIYGWSAEEVLGKESLEILQTDFLTIPREEVIKNIFAQGSYFGEVIQLRKDGSPIDVEVNTILLKDVNEKPTGFLAVARVITERKLARTLVQESQSQLTQIIETAMDAIISIDQSKKIVLFNRAAELMFGYLSVEMIGQTVDRLIPQEFRANHNSHIDSFEATGVSRRAMGQLGQIKGVRANGEEFPIEASISQISVKGEKLFTVILRDETARNHSEAKIQKLLSEKEQILKEIHHRVKNNMTAIFTLLSMQANSQKEETTQTILYEAAGRVKSMVVLYDKLYHSNTDNSVFVKDYFPAILQEIVSIFPKKVKLNIHIVDDEIQLAARVLSSLGIILNEMITNSMKHGFLSDHDHQINFELTKSSNKVQLIYSDNGGSFPESVSFQNTPGFGLQLISMLVSQIDGTIEIERESGAKFKIEFGLPEKNNI
jgi:PAS domain S-box-containing protein